MSAIYEMVTTQIIDALSRGVVPWRKPWRETPLPENAISKRPYRGVNVFLLGLTAFRDHRWLTFRQAQELGGYLRRGEESKVAIFWKRWEPPAKGDESQSRTITLLRYYRVFNVEQCEGLRIAALDQESAPAPRNYRAEEIVQSMPNPPRVRETGDTASYNPRLDLVQIPPIGAFASPDAYYATLFHELGHSTGHESRLNRPGVAGEIRSGSCSYSREELIAELTSAYCCADAELDNSLVESSASYINGWLDALRSDKKAIVVAAAKAQRAADYIRGALEPESDTDD